MLEVRDLHSSYGKVEVLRGVSLNVGDGEIVGLLGRNGVGKTTTLKAIMGLVRTSAGRATFDGVDLTDIAAHKVPGQGIGYVPQGRGIFPNLTVEENLFLGLRGEPSAPQRAAVFDRFPQLHQRLFQKGGTLSGGEQQQLAIARCLVMQPKLLILDEPTEGIMPILIKKIRSEIRKINSSGVSILLVEQNLATAFKICSVIYLMEKGSIVHRSSAAELKNRPDVIHRYLGMAA